MCEDTVRLIILLPDGKTWRRFSVLSDAFADVHEHLSPDMLGRSSALWGSQRSVPSWEPDLVLHIDTPSGSKQIIPHLQHLLESHF